MIKVVAFDLDDTLWAVDPVIIQAEKKLQAYLESRLSGFDYTTLREHRQSVFEENPEFAFRLTAFRQRIIETAVAAAGHKDADQIAEEAMGVFLLARNDVDFFPGAVEAIQTMAPLYELGALTNGNADISLLGLSDHFSFAFSAEAVGAPKPAPDLFHKALDHTGVNPEQMVYVGDDPEKDVDAPASLGLKTVWMRTERRPGPPSYAPDAIIDDIKELPEAVASLSR